MDMTTCRQIYPGLALMLALPGHAIAEALDFDAKQYSLGGVIEPASIVVGDFNGDGIPDVATANFVSNDVSLLYGNRHGGFRESRSFPVGREPRAITSGDFNRDGMEDVATVNSRSGNVAVLLGRPAGFGFEKAKFFPVHGYATDLAVGDFNRDGRLDLASVTGEGLSQGTVSILLGRGNGSFRPVKTFLAGDPWSVAVDDFNRDGKADLVTADANPDKVSVLLGNGDGSFQPAQFFPTGDFPIEIALGDFDRDGAPDAVTINEESGDISILPGNRDGGFQAPRPLHLGGFPGSVAVGDFNRDGALDLSAIVGGPEDDDNVVVLLGNGDGSFDVPQYFAARRTKHRGVSEIAVGDFNRDGALDMVTTLSGTGEPFVPYAVSVLIQQRSQ